LNDPKADMRSISMKPLSAHIHRGVATSPSSTPGLSRAFTPTSRSG
jgi:hypothetical protein